MLKNKKATGTDMKELEGSLMVIHGTGDDNVH